VKKTFVGSFVGMIFGFLLDLGALSWVPVGVTGCRSLGRVLVRVTFGLGSYEFRIFPIFFANFSKQNKRISKTPLEYIGRGGCTRIFA
jgi:hypothetical protein